MQRLIGYALLGIISITSFQSAHADFAAPLAITNARIVNPGAAPIENGTIVIDHGRITAVGQNTVIPPNAERYNAGGATVYPGFIDANTHAGVLPDEASPEERKRLEDDDPDVRDGPQSATVRAYRRLMHPHWRAEEHYDTQSAKPEQARACGFTTALISPKPAIFSGASAVIELGDTPLRRSILRGNVAQHSAFITGIDRDLPREMRERQMDSPAYPTTLMGAIAAFRQIMSDAQWQRDLTTWSQRNPKGERPALDGDLDALLAPLNGRQPVVFIANRENEIRRALDLAAEFKLKPIIAGGREAWKCVDRLKAESVPVIVSLKWSDEPKRDDKKPPSTQEAAPPDRLAAVFDDKWQQQPWESQRQFDERKRLWGEEVDNLKKLNEAGLKVAIGSFEMESPADVLKNLREALKRGLPEDVALASLTQNAAAVLGLDADLGEIAPGKLANLVIMTKPLADEKSKVRLVFVEGKRLDTADVAEGGGPDKGRFRGRRGARDKDDEKNKDESEDSASSASQPATTSQPVDWPGFRCEVETDRKPEFQTGGNLLIKNANLLTVTDGDQPETDLLLRNGKIEQIGKNLSAPAGTKTLNLHGYFITPGIIDPHSHMCSDGGLNEAALSVTPEVRVRDVLDHRDVGAYRALAGGVTCIHTMHGSANTIGGQNATLRLKYGKPAAEWLFKDAPRTVKFALGENVKQSNFGRRGSRFPNSRMGVEAVLRRSFDAARQYQLDQKKYAEEKAVGKDPRPVRRDLRLEALSDILDGAIWVHSHCYRADEILRLLDVAEQYGFRIAVLQHILEGYRIIPEIIRHGCGASTFSDWWSYKIEAFDAIPQNAARMMQGGIVTTVNSDSNEMIRHLPLEAAKSVHFGGLSSNDALKLCTLNGAIQLGVDKLVGSLQPGKLGDIAIFNGHPLDTSSKCVMTLIDGEVYFQDASLNPSSPPTPRPIREFRATRPQLPIRRSTTNTYRITDATIHPVGIASVFPAELLIQDGRVQYIGPPGKAGDAPDVVPVDARGLHVYPGLINAAATLGLTEIDSVAGTVDVADIGRFQPDIRAESAYDPFVPAIEVTRAEGVLNALIVPGGGMIPGQAALMQLDGWTMPEALVRSNVGLMINVPSLPPDLTAIPERRRKEVKENYAKQLGELDTFMKLALLYSQVAAAAKQQPALSPEFDRQLDAMIPYVRGERPVLLNANSYKEIRESLRFAEQFSLKPIIVGGRDAWKLADDLAKNKVDVILGRVQSYPAGDFEPWDGIYRNAGVLAQAGVRFCFSTGNSDLAKLLGVEAGMAVAHGLEEDRALRALTIDAAKILGVGDSLGSLEPGKSANLIICTDTPLQASNTVVAAFIAGKPVDLTSKHTRLDEKFRQRPGPTLSPAPALKGPPAIRTEAAVIPRGG